MVTSIYSDFNGGAAKQITNWNLGLLLGSTPPTSLRTSVSNDSWTYDTLGRAASFTAPVVTGLPDCVGEAYSPRFDSDADWRESAARILEGLTSPARRSGPLPESPMPMLWPDSNASADDLLRVAIDAAHEAGAILKDWAGRFTITEKSRANLVTEADFASQKAIHERIHGRFRDHNFLGEEGLAETNSDSPWRWVIDPLDGTSNYVHGFPYYAVNIAAEFGKELMIAVTFDPNRDELFTAVRGRGAFVNGQQIRPTRVTALQDAMVVASLPVACRPEHHAVKQLLNVMPHVQTVQRTGSAALNLAYVAAGRMDAFWSGSLKPWDMAAGILLVQEAGGRVTRMHGEPIDIEIPDLLSSNGSAIHDALQQLL